MALFVSKQKQDARGGMTFGGSSQAQPGDLQESAASMSRKLRLIEDRYTYLQKKAGLSEQNIIGINKKLNSEAKAINTELLELRHLIDELDGKLLLIIKELKLSAKKDEVDLLKKYIELWNPIRFVTRKEVENIVNDLLDDRQEK